MVNLTSKQQAFVRQMAEGDDFARRGVDLLLKRDDFEEFFDPLAAAHIFDADRNPGPVEGDTPGFFRIPYWEPLRYLESVAKKSGEKNDPVLAAKVMGVVRNVSAWRDADGKVRDNHYTFNSFAKILGFVPTASVTLADIDLMPTWLSGKFNTSTVAFALVEGTLKRYLSSDSADDWKKACRMVAHATAIDWAGDKFLDEKRPTTKIQDYWVKEIVKRAAQSLGAKLGPDAVSLFVQRAKEAFSQGVAARYSYICRAAVEDHDQNHSWRGPESWSVSGLRDALLSWIDVDAEAARRFVESMYNDEAEIIRRVSIYAIDARFETLMDLYPGLIAPALFSVGHLHELYNLLKNHFAEFNDDEKSATLAAIRQLQTSPKVEDSDRSLKYLQRQWLSAIAGAGFPEAETWFQELSNDQTLGGLSPHPDFMSYMETRWGHGPTPYPVQELVAFAKDGIIVDQLNSFTQRESWSGPSTRSLVDALVEAVGAEPALFLTLIDLFLAAKRPYQYGLISGFKKVWDAPPDSKRPADIDWNKAWPKLMDFFDSLIRPDPFWTEDVTESDVLTPTREWIPSVISDFLRAGTREDKKAYDPSLLPQGWLLIEILVRRSIKQNDADPSRAMDKAINSPKGQAIEALVDHALRFCRVSDARAGNHADAWAAMVSLFDEQLEECQNANYEFSTLAGAYIAHIHYMSADWCERNFAKVFPKDFPQNCLSAIDGLAWAPPSAPIYDLLVNHGIVIWALRNSPAEFRARENILERIALAYLWEKETFNSDNFNCIFGEKRFGDLQHIAQYLWSVSGQPLTEKQKCLIIEFWKECVARTPDAVPAHLLSALSRLSVYVTSLGEPEEALLLAVAPHVGVEYNADDFFKDLGRLVDASPAAVCRVLDATLKGYKPDFDFEDRLKKLLRKLALHRDTRDDALRLAERLVGELPGMVEFYQEITSLRPA